jgi:hypothetical protein
MRRSTFLAGISFFLWAPITWSASLPEPLHSNTLATGPKSGPESKTRWILGVETQGESAPVSAWWEGSTHPITEYETLGRVSTRLFGGLGSSASSRWSVEADFGARWEPGRWSFEPPRLRTNLDEWAIASNLHLLLGWEARFPPWLPGFATLPPGLGLRQDASFAWTPWGITAPYFRISTGLEYRLLSQREAKAHSADFVGELSVQGGFPLSPLLRIEGGIRTGLLHRAALPLPALAWAGLAPGISVSGFIHSNLYYEAWGAWPLGTPARSGPFFGTRVSFGFF